MFIPWWIIVLGILFFLFLTHEIEKLAGKIDELDERINELENRGTRETIETDVFSDFNEPKEQDNL